MDHKLLLCFLVTTGDTYQYVLKQIFLLWSVVASAAFMAEVSLVSILQAGKWARVSTLAGHYFST